MAEGYHKAEKEDKLLLILVEVIICYSWCTSNGEITVIETEECGWCLLCELVCPTGAISWPYEIVIEERQMLVSFSLIVAYRFL